MATYLCLWNPKRDPTFPEVVRQFEAEGRTQTRWSCGNAVGIVPGDRAILRRTGTGPRGVVGIGVVRRGTFKELFDDGTIGHFVEIEWERLAVSPMVTSDDDRLSSLEGLWSNQAGGTALTEEVADVVFAVVRGDQGAPDHGAADATVREAERALFAEGRAMERKVTIRERHASVRDHCLAAHQSICAACGFDPDRTLGAEFAGAMEVHHLHPVAGGRRAHHQPGSRLCAAVPDMPSDSAPRDAEREMPHHR